ncbi:hypothetical protein SAMN04490244_10713 [Tranquillimonas rosea]|uniref:Uncharacterized protein n=1 Tax=Tranquillimonas rosea TaxID=641238 RepID=A0A1H9VDS9_9RHOB|nr:hypothetical protein SAMN04490244_10713 [Tranquillimonas rosea]
MAASRNSPFAPHGPRSRSLSKPRMCLRCANSISTFFRSFIEITYWSVFAMSRATYRASSCSSRVIDRKSMLGSNATSRGRPGRCVSGTGMWRRPCRSARGTDPNSAGRTASLRGLPGRCIGFSWHPTRSPPGSRCHRCGQTCRRPECAVRSCARPASQASVLCRKQCSIFRAMLRKAAQAHTVLIVMVHVTTRNGLHVEAKRCDSSRNHRSATPSGRR